VQDASTLPARELKSAIAYLRQRLHSVPDPISRCSLLHHSRKCWPLGSRKSSASIEGSDATQENFGDAEMLQIPPPSLSFGIPHFKQNRSRSSTDSLCHILNSAVAAADAPSLRCWPWALTENGGEHRRGGLWRSAHCSQTHRQRAIKKLDRLARLVVEVWGSGVRIELEADWSDVNDSGVGWC